ncbi:hypothetical protein [Actinoplanes flavus]|uniref:Uncharacterized protein n=1 Tax=Actinoplanes flavus TaxID=2820290 RepID=A0ABS3UCU7_9ACTN|nr:hypothetical protein [Actinoplanes flavus]MBO3736602.1 hypothetical protein [Actinoplanes flavus]
MQIWTTVTTILGDLFSLAGGIITLGAAIKAQRRPRRRQCVLHTRRGGEDS